MATRTAAVRALLLASMVTAACGSAGSGPGSGPAPGPQSPALDWRPGQSIHAAVTQHLTTDTQIAGTGGGPVTATLGVTAQQTLAVQSIVGGVADLRVTVGSWSWLHPDGPAPVGSPPPPADLRVGADGLIRSGSYWSMPQDPPMPGLDLLSGGLPPPASRGPWSVSWSRTTASGVPMACQAQGGAPSAGKGGASVETRIHCQATVHRVAVDLSPDLLRGDVQALAVSTYDIGRGRLLATSYTANFTATDSTAQDVTTTGGRVTTTLRFSY